MSHSHEEVKKHVKTYIAVFVALAFLTVVTVAISYLHLPAFQAVVLALIVATIKASLVGLFFMHLISEKQIIVAILILTFVFLAGMFLLIPLTGIWVPSGYVA